MYSRFQFFVNSLKKTLHICKYLIEFFLKVLFMYF
jgi:hypothetical protein